MKLRILVPALAMTVGFAVSAQPIIHRDSANEYFSPLIPNTQGGFYSFNPPYENAANYIFHNNWNASDFTGAPIAMNATSQASRVGYYGSTVFQKGNGYAAYFINTYAHPSENELNHPMINSNTSVAAAFGGSLNHGGVKIFDRGYSSRICLSTNYKMNYYYRESGGRAQSYIALFLQDLTTGKHLPITIRTWHSSDPMGESKGVDPYVGGFVESYFGPGSRYVTQQPDSMNTITGESETVDAMNQNKFFSACITKQNMMNIINDINAMQPNSYSTDLTKYIAYQSFNQTEVLGLRTPQGPVDINDTSTFGPYNVANRMHIAATWWNNLVQSLN